jgi:hypothetical protein
MLSCTVESDGAGAACAVFVAVLLAGCGVADADPDLTSVRDSAGIAIVENQWPDSADIAWWVIEAPPLADIGGEDGGEAYALYQVSSAARLADGRIVVANGGGGDVRYFSEDGEHLRTSGRRGGGPGEFQRPGQIFVAAGDTVLVADPFVRRISVLDPQGTFVRELATAAAGGDGAAFFSPTESFEDGTLLGIRGFSPDMNSTEVQRPDMAIVTMSPSGDQDTLMTIPGSEMRLTIRRRAAGSGPNAIGSISIGRPPFRKSTGYAVGNGSLYVGTQDAAEVRVYGRDGTLRRIVRTGATLRPVTPDDVSAWIDFETADLDPEQQQQRRAALSADPPGDVIPPYGSIEVDRAGNLWIADFDTRVAPRGRWTVYDPEGRILARVQLPPGINIQEIADDYVLGIVRDELDVEHVRLYTLLRP